MRVIPLQSAISSRDGAGIGLALLAFGTFFAGLWVIGAGQMRFYRWATKLEPIAWRSVLRLWAIWFAGISLTLLGIALVGLTWNRHPAKEDVMTVAALVPVASAAFAAALVVVQVVPWLLLVRFAQRRNR